jgi:hypothetical protein
MTRNYSVPDRYPGMPENPADDPIGQWVKAYRCPSCGGKVSSHGDWEDNPATAWLECCDCGDHITFEEETDE